ncbi:MAG: hypothetical protein QXL94_01090 [Candidatus Parvarchaeum sp.]
MGILSKIREEIRQGLKEREIFKCEECGEEFELEQEWYVHMVMHSKGAIETPVEEENDELSK